MVIDPRNLCCLLWL